MMLATALRKSILQAAIAGQLTEQRADDGDARDLLAAIRKEKTRLVRAGKLKKERPLPEICEDDVPFEIPENWCWARLGDVALKIHYGFTASASVTGNAKLLRITDIQNNHVSWQDVPRCTVAEHALVDYRLQNRDIVIARTGGTIGKSYIVRELDDVAVFASYLIRVIPSAHINESYLKRFMESPLYWKQLEAKSQGTGQPNVNGKALSNLMLPLPPLTEQERIVQFLQSLTPELTKLEADEHELDALTSAFPARMKSSLLLAAMRGELTEREEGDGDARDLLKTIEREKKRLIKEKKLKREKPLPPVAEEDVPFEIPETWCWCRLGDVAIFQNGDRGKNYPKRTEYTTRGIPWVNAGHITADGFLSETSMNFISIDKYQELRNGKFQRGDLVYCLRGTLGKVGRIEPYSEGAVASSLMIIRPMVPNVYFREYIFHYLKSALARRQLLQFDNGSAQPNLAAKDVAKYLIPLPPLAEQRRIVARLEELLGAVENG